MTDFHPAPKPPDFRRWLPLVALACLVAGAYALGLQHYFSLDSIASHKSKLVDYVSMHLILSILMFTLLYVLVVSLSLPGAGILSIVGGFVFGWALSVPITLVAAMIGAVIVFQIVKTSAGAAIAERAGPFVTKLSAGFKQDAFNYLLFLRLVPAFPFFAVNAVAGLAQVNLRTFVIATFFGIIPGSIAFAWLGRGLGSVIDEQTAVHDACVASQDAAQCPFDISLASLVTPQLLVAFAALGGVALIPVALKKWNASK
jgi:uncharacterized membrane protein YdjX (TVP38/TMEM64 family)